VSAPCSPRGDQAASASTAGYPGATGRAGRPLPDGPAPVERARSGPRGAYPPNSLRRHRRRAPEPASSLSEVRSADSTFKPRAGLRMTARLMARSVSWLPFRGGPPHARLLQPLETLLMEQRQHLSGRQPDRCCNEGHPVPISAAQRDQPANVPPDRGGPPPPPQGETVMTLLEPVPGESSTLFSTGSPPFRGDEATSRRRCFAALGLRISLVPALRQGPQAPPHSPCFRPQSGSRARMRRGPSSSSRRCGSSPWGVTHRCGDLQ
jgi:hypothetical protein